jgi:hypothetical protein
MNKRTGEFSAADLKKPIGRREASGHPKKGTGRLDSTSPVPGRFVCCSCRLDHPVSELGNERGGAGWNKGRCKTCATKAAAIKDGSYRDSHGRTYEASQRSKHKTPLRGYKSGRLPKWMFS